MPHKVFTSFDVAADVHELKSILTDSRVNNIYQLGSKMLLLKLHKTDTSPLLLLLESGRRFHLTAYAQEKPTAPPAFCMALRKYLRNAWLSSVEQHEFERIVTFTFETQTGLLRLALELFGEGNIVLTSGKGEILQALVLKRMRDRNILRGETYALPPPSGRNPFTTTREQLAEDLRNNGDAEVVRVIARSLGVGGVYAEETLLRAGIEKTKRCKELTEPEIDTIYEALESILHRVAGAQFASRIVMGNDDEYLDVVPFPLKRYEACNSKVFGTFNEALDEFYLRVVANEKAAEATPAIEGLKREAEKMRRVVVEQEQALREAEARADQERQIGDLIYAHSVEVQALLERFNEARIAGKDLNAFALQAWQKADHETSIQVDDFDSRNLAVNVHVGAVHFSVGIRKSLFENAAEYYEHGKKAKQKAAGALTALEESREKLVNAEEQLRAAEAAQQAKPAEVMEELAKRKVEGKEWFEKFRWFTSLEGFLVVAGKDTVSNEVLVKKHTDKDDAVFHADVTGAPFVVVKIEGRQPNEQTLREASEFAAAFSRGWREGLAAVDVYWVKPEQLSKTGPSGEFVPHGAFAVVGKRNWMRGTPLRTAVGVVENNETAFIGGPVEAVKTKAKVYVVLVPGDVMGKELLKQILWALAAKLPKEEREKIAKASIEEIRDFVPYTKGRIVSGTS